MESVDEKRNNLNVVVTYRDTRVEFSGSPETVLESLHRFLAKEIPELDLASKISLSYSAPELIDAYSEYIKITPEGPRVIVEKKLSDKDLISLQLVAYRIAKELGKVDNDGLSPQELQNITSLNPKSVSSRLSELVKANYVQKESNEQGVRYKITTQGIHWLTSNLLKRIKE